MGAVIEALVPLTPPQAHRGFQLPLMSRGQTPPDPLLSAFLLWGFWGSTRAHSACTGQPGSRKGQGIQALGARHLSTWTRVNKQIDAQLLPIGGSFLRAGLAAAVRSGTRNSRSWLFLLPATPALICASRDHLPNKQPESKSLSHALLLREPKVRWGRGGVQGRDDSGLE